MFFLVRSRRVENVCLNCSCSCSCRRTVPRRRTSLITTWACVRILFLTGTSILASSPRTIGTPRPVRLACLRGTDVAWGLGRQSSGLPTPTTCTRLTWQSEANSVRCMRYHTTLLPHTLFVGSGYWFSMPERPNGLSTAKYATSNTTLPRCVRNCKP
jgi:hypothetical protein